MPNVMAALPHIGGALCSTPTSRVPCSNAAKTRNPLKFAGVPKLANGSQPLVGVSSPYCENMWGRHCCLTSFSPIVDTCLSWKDIVVRWCADGDFWHSWVADDRRGRTRTAVWIRSFGYTDRCAGVEDESTMNISVIIL